MNKKERRTNGLLTALIGGITGGGIRIIDLTMTLDQQTPTIVLPPEWGQSWPFRLEVISHWISGKDLPNNATDTIPPELFIAHASVIDVSTEAMANPDYLLTIERVTQWEKQHGEIPSRSWLLMRTDWSKKTDPVEYLNQGEEGANTPGPHQELIPWLIEERNVVGFGSEGVGTDAGQASHFPIPMPCHHLMHGAGRFGLPALTNLDLLPPMGTVLIAAPLKIRQGSGSPVRALALVEEN